MLDSRLGPNDNKRTSYVFTYVVMAGSTGKKKNKNKNKYVPKGSEEVEVVIVLTYPRRRRYKPSYTKPVYKRIPKDTRWKKKPILKKKKKSKTDSKTSHYKMRLVCGHTCRLRTFEHISRKFLFYEIQFYIPYIRTYSVHTHISYSVSLEISTEC